MDPAMDAAAYATAVRQLQLVVQSLKAKPNRGHVPADASEALRVVEELRRDVIEALVAVQVVADANFAVVGNVAEALRILAEALPKLEDQIEGHEARIQQQEAAGQA